MKSILRLLIFLCITILTFVSCSDEYIKGIYIASNTEYSLNMGTSDLQSISAAGGVVKMRVEATSAVNWELQGLPSWLSTTTLNGTGSQDVSFNVEANGSFTSSRTHIFNIVTTNSDWKFTIPVSVTQLKNAKEMTISPSDDASLTFDSKGGQKTLSITSNVAWNAECKEDFVHLSQSSAVQDLNMVVSVDAYDQIDITQKRTASIYFKETAENNVLKIITITQTPLQTSISTENIPVEFDKNINTKVFSLGNIQSDYSVSSDEPWLSIEKNKGDGKVDVTISVKANENDDERTSKAYVFLDNTNTILYSFSVRQKGNCIEINPTNLPCSAGGGVYSIDVITNERWTASTEQEWLSLQESGNSCRITVTENNSLQTRSGAVRFNRLNEKNEVVGKTVTLTISQEARYITPDMQTIQFGPEADQKTLPIYSDASWTLTTDESWISLSSGGGSGDAEVIVGVSDNTSSSSRTGSLYLKCLDNTIEILVVQNTAYLNTDSNPIRFEAKGGTTEIGIFTNVSWTANANKNWLSVSPESGSGDAKVVLTASANTSNQRSAVLSISTLVGPSNINITQSAPTLELSEYNVLFDEKGGTKNIIVTADFDYQVTPSAAWIRIDQYNNSFKITVKENTGATRSGTVVVQLIGVEGTIKKTINVKQNGDDTPYIDLGLPSNTKWGAYNKGATKVGGDGSVFTGSQSDSYKCPSSEQVDELLSKCSWNYETLEGVTGYLVTGPNGNSIFFPSTPTVSLGGTSQTGMYVWVRGSANSEKQYYLTYHRIFGPKQDYVAHKDDSKFSIREVRQ